MRILVTGGLGFIGSNFILHILKKYKDFEIINIDAESFGSNHNNLTEVEHFKNYRFVKGNITDKQLMENLISKCDMVVNFAAESHVDRSIVNAEPFLLSNILGTFTILDIIKNQNKRLVQISTDEVFGSIQSGSVNENSRFNPSSPYSASKASAELIINSYFVTYNCDVVITRCTNNYGPRQFPEKLIPRTIILALQDKKIPVYGTGNSIRDWIFVEDHCDAIMLVLQKGKKGESYNISASNEIDNLTIVKKILLKLNKSEKLIKFVNSRPGEDFRYSLKSSKIQKELGWSQKTNFEEGLDITIKWYLENEQWWKKLPKNVFVVPTWKN